MVIKLLEHYMKKNSKRQNKQSLQLKKEVINYMSSGKIMIIRLIFG